MAEQPGFVQPRTEAEGRHAAAAAPHREWRGSAKLCSLA